MSFLSSYGTVIAFYIIIVLIIALNKKKFSFEAKFIALYRTKIGVKFMEFLGKKCSRTIRVLGLIGVYIGFLGMLLAAYTIIEGIYKLLFIPEAPASFAPVIPGVHIPGVEIFVPFWYGIIALFFVVVIHEFSHGLVAAAYKLRIKHTGFVMFGPLPGAFVEPDEKKVAKSTPKTQLSIYAAGPFANVLLTLLFILLFGFLPLFANALGAGGPGVESFSQKISIINFAEIRGEMYQVSGLTIGSIVNESPAGDAQLPITTITSINDVSITKNVTLFANTLGTLKPYEEITLGTTNGTYRLITSPHPDNSSKGYIGVAELSFEESVNEETRSSWGPFIFGFYDIIFNQVFWIIILSLGIGLANLLPLGPVDGGRMYFVVLKKFFNEKTAKKIWSKTASILLIALIVLVFTPILKAIIN